MSSRPITTPEQPEKLHAHLQEAAIIAAVPHPEPEATKEPVAPHGKFATVTNFLKSIFRWAFSQRPTTPKKKEVPIAYTLVNKDAGVPHGVVDALVFVRNVNIVHAGNGTQVRFCHTTNYMAVESTLDGADGGNYPPIDRSRISLGCKLPSEGLHTARLRVSVNGRVTVHVEAFDVDMPKIEELASV